MALETALRYHIIRNTFGRWMIVNPRDPELAWSGSCWVEHEDGVSRGRDRVAYFDSQEEAEQHARGTWGGI
jgi:hypothetical protein